MEKKVECYKDAGGQRYQIFFKEEDEYSEGDELTAEEMVSPTAILPPNHHTQGSSAAPGDGAQVVLYERRRLRAEELSDEEDEDEDEESVRLLGTQNWPASLESVNLEAGEPPRFLIKTDSDLDLLLLRPSRWQEAAARMRWLRASAGNCPPWRSYLSVAGAVLGVLALYAVLVVVIMQAVGGG